GLKGRAGYRRARRCCPTSGGSTPKSKRALSTRISNGFGRSSVPPATTSRPSEGSGIGSWKVRPRINGEDGPQGEAFSRPFLPDRHFGSRNESLRFAADGTSAH